MPITDIITPQWIRDQYLYGIDLTDDDGNAFPDELFRQQIDMAVDLIETEFDVQLNGNRSVVDERHDTTLYHGKSFYMVYLDHRPVLSIDELKVQYGEFEPNKIPKSWAHVFSKDQGQVQIIVSPEGLAGTLITGGIPFVGISGMQFRHYTPGWWVYSYTAGFESTATGTVSVSNGDDKITGTDTKFTSELKRHQWVLVGDQARKVKKVSSDTQATVYNNWTENESGEDLWRLDYPNSIIESVSLLASLLPLDTAGDLILGAGVFNKTVSMDGLSQSVQKLGSAENPGFGARSNQYIKRLQQASQIVRRRFRMPKMAIL